MAKQQITNNEYLQLLGLQVLASKHYRMTNDIQRSVASIIGHEDSLVGDCLWDENNSIAEALQKMGIEVVDA
jgi:hypothetical protein